jgi:hypothetical protein
MSATDHCELPKATHPTSLQAVNFKDGMIVTADDLATAMRYPLAVFQTLVRAYFGCGIVCGLGVKPVGPAAADPSKNPGPGQVKPNYMVSIDRGVALGCDGYPIELCAPVSLDLTPDPCCPHNPTTVCIAIRRITSDGAPRQDCGCSGNGSSPQYQCTRVKDQVLIQAFAGEPPTGTCAKPRPAAGRADPAGPAPTPAPDPRTQICECLKACSDCDACGESWVLLACVKIDNGIRSLDVTGRKYVKPIECLCETGVRDDHQPPATPQPPGQQPPPSAPQPPPANPSPAQPGGLG